MMRRALSGVRAVAWVGLLCLSCLLPGAHAQAVLGEGAGRIDLWPHMRMLDDPGRALSIEQVLPMGDRFAAPRAANATLGMDKTVVWLRAPVTVMDGGEGTWVLDLD